MNSMDKHYRKSISKKQSNNRLYFQINDKQRIFSANDVLSFGGVKQIL
jgi:hypothetical protein